MLKELKELDKLEKSIKEKRAKELEKILNGKFAGKYIKIDWIEEGFVSAKVRKINTSPFSDNVEIEGAIVGNLHSLQEWTEF